MKKLPRSVYFLNTLASLPVSEASECPFQQATSSRHTVMSVKSNYKPLGQIHINRDRGRQTGIRETQFTAAKIITKMLHTRTRLHFLSNSI